MFTDGLMIIYHNFVKCFSEINLVGEYLDFYWIDKEEN